jgi:hypothetical protein
VVACPTARWRGSASGGVVDEASTGDTRGNDREAEVWHFGSAEARPPQPFLVEKRREERRKSGTSVAHQVEKRGESLRKREGERRGKVGSGRQGREEEKGDPCARGRQRVRERGDVIKWEKTGAVRVRSMIP